VRTCLLPIGASVRVAAPSTGGRRGLRHPQSPQIKCMAKAMYTVTVSLGAEVVGRLL
jgi:hypothetical protein